MKQVQGKRVTLHLGSYYNFSNSKRKLKNPVVESKTDTGREKRPVKTNVVKVVDGGGVKLGVAFHLARVVRLRQVRAKDRTKRRTKRRF